MLNEPGEESRRDERFLAVVLVAGFGLPGRSIAERLDALQVHYSVVEMNEEVARRCHRPNRQVVTGDARDLDVLMRAGLMHVRTVALMMPVEAAVLQAIPVVRSVRPDVHVIARTAFTSAGIESHRLGANTVIVAEQVVATAAAESMVKLWDNLQRAETRTP